MVGTPPSLASLLTHRRKLMTPRPNPKLLLGFLRYLNLKVK